MLKYLLSIYLFFLTCVCFSQVSQCEPNIDFEDGSYSGWHSSSSGVTGSYFSNCCPGGTGNLTVTNMGMPNDLLTNIPVTAPNGSIYSIKLGADVSGSSIRMNKLDRILNITANNFLLTYNYSVVLLKCQSYASQGAAAAIIFFTDQSGDTIPCTQQYFNALDNHVSGFTLDTLKTFSPMYYLPWQSKTLDFSGYIGQHIKANFITRVCNGNVHFAYMYLDFVCNEPVRTTFCTGQGNLCAPPGCASYWWTTPIASHSASSCIPALQAGTYSVQIPAQKTCISDTTALTYTISPPPIANFSYQTSCQSLDYSFQDLSTIGPDTVCARGWQIQNSNFTNSAFNYHFNTPGNYPVSLIAANCDNTCSDTVIKLITVSAPLHAGFNALQTGCAGDIISFSNTSSTAHSIADAWNFNFSQSTASNPVIKYSTAGIYPVKLIILDSLGCKDSITKNITILPLPKIKILPENMCVGVLGKFSGGLTDTVTVSDWKWDFQNDGVIDSDGIIAQAAYPVQGDFWVKLLATSVSGCLAKDSSLIHVYPLPSAAFKIKEEYNPQINFINNSTTPLGSSIISSLWSFGEDAAYDNMASTVSYTYNQPGAYNVLLTVTNNFGCTDTISHSLIIAADFGIYIPNAFTPNGDGLNDIFKVEYFGIKSYKLTVFDRWGAVVFKSENMDEGWDGTVKQGSETKQDVYVWKLEYRRFSGANDYMTGHVTLIK